MADELVHYDVRRGTAVLTLDSPANRNALSRSLMSRLGDLLTRAGSDPQVRVIVLAHAGRVFCSGMDLTEARGDAATMPVTELPRILQAVWESPKPVVAQVGGPARAGGLGLIAASDIAVAARSATFAFSEVRIGVVPATIAPTVLPRVAPRAVQELFLTGSVFDGDRAAEIGLVTEAVDDGDVESAVARYVDLLARGGPEALAETKRLLREASAPALAEEFAAMSAVSARRFASAEGQEGIAAFREKRAPRWAADL